MSTTSLIEALTRLQRASAHPTECATRAHGPMSAITDADGIVKWRCGVCGHEEAVPMTLIRLAELGLI